MTTEYVDALIKAFPCISEIWLFGSRANGSPRPDSDWDYLVYSDDERLMNALCRDDRFHRSDIDTFVVSGHYAYRPWPDPDGYHRKLRLDTNEECDGCHWHAIGSSSAATYLDANDQPARARLVHRRGDPDSV